MKLALLILLALAGCAQTQFVTVCQLPPIRVEVGSFDRYQSEAGAYHMKVMGTKEGEKSRPTTRPCSTRSSTFWAFTAQGSSPRITTGLGEEMKTIEADGIHRFETIYHDTPHQSRKGKPYTVVINGYAELVESWEECAKLYTAFLTGRDMPVIPPLEPITRKVQRMEGV